MSEPCGVCATTASGRRTRGLCNRCYSRALHDGRLHEWPRKTRTWAETVADAAFLADAGEDPSRWPERLGMNAEAIGKACHRAGRPDLARPMWRLVDAARRQTRKAIEQTDGG